MTAIETISADKLYTELWVSLASLLRSYTAAHGLNGKTQATIELGEDRITARRGDKWMNLNREGSNVTWSRENGTMGTMQLTEDGRLRDRSMDEELDLAAEAWARELMQ